MRVRKPRAGNSEAPKAAFYRETGSRIGPIRKRYVGTQGGVQLSNVASHNAHSQLLISRPGCHCFGSLVHRAALASPRVFFIHPRFYTLKWLGDTVETLAPSPLPCQAGGFGGHFSSAVLLRLACVLRRREHQKVDMATFQSSIILHAWTGR
jgi:hypothetical protein